MTCFDFIVCKEFNDDIQSTFSTIKNNDKPALCLFNCKVTIVFYLQKGLCKRKDLLHYSTVIFFRGLVLRNCRFLECTDFYKKYSIWVNSFYVKT